MKNILLLTDFSDNALNAIHYALNFFKHETCTFHLMNVHKVGSFTSDQLMYSAKESVYESITKEPRAKLEKLVLDLKEIFKNESHTFKTSIDFDVFTDAVKQSVTKEQIDYIIIGSNGATGAKEVVFGSNTLNVLRKVNCKTLVIPEDYKYKPIKRLLLALDPKDSLTGDAFTDLLEFINTYQLNLHVLRNLPHHETSENEESDILNLSIIDCEYYKVDDIPLNHAVNTYLQTNAIDVASLFSRKENFLERLFKGSSTTQLSRSIRVPLLVLRS